MPGPHNFSTVGSAFSFNRDPEESAAQDCFLAKLTSSGSGGEHHVGPLGPSPKMTPPETANPPAQAHSRHCLLPRSYGMAIPFGRSHLWVAVKRGLRFGRYGPSHSKRLRAKILELDDDMIAAYSQHDSGRPTSEKLRNRSRRLEFHTAMP